ncbi:MAG TPA: SOS response-associated peptidase [Polyangiaceae bacterium]|nr:SOS response-associated peptidase [Polyangiaceae bacterium]
MCGRYTNDAEFSEIRLAFKAEPFQRFGSWKPTYNITPSYGPGFEQLIVVGNRTEGRVLRLGRWWLIPWFWNKSLKSLPTSFNARVEDVESKPLWREAFRSTRCLVPATGWREFTGTRGQKQPYHFRLPAPLFAFAGLWSTWTSDVGEVVDSFAIITAPPNPIAAKIHDRMPLVLPEGSYGEWLDQAGDPALVLQEAQARSLELPLQVFPSDPIGNSGRYEGPRVIEPVTIAPAQQELFGGKAR